MRLSPIENLYEFNDFVYPSVGSSSEIQFLYFFLSFSVVSRSQSKSHLNI